MATIYFSNGEQTDPDQLPEDQKPAFYQAMQGLSDPTLNTEGIQAFDSPDKAQTYADANTMSQLHQVTTGEFVHPDEIYAGLRQSNESPENLQTMSIGQPSQSLTPDNTQSKSQNSNKVFDTGSDTLDELLSGAAGTWNSIPGSSHVNAGIQTAMDKVQNPDVTDIQSDFDKNLKMMNGINEQAKQENPKSYLGGEVLGDTGQYLAGSEALKALVPLLAPTEGAMAGNALKGVIRGVLVNPAITLGKGDTDTKDLQKSAAFGAGGELAGSAIESGINELAPEAKSIINTIFKPTQSEIDSGAAEAVGNKTLADQFLNEGKFGTADSIKAHSQSQLPVLEAQRDSIVNGIKQVNPETHASEIYKQMMNDIPEASFNPTNAKPYVTRINRILGQMDEGTSFDGPSYQAAKRDLQGQASNAYKSFAKGNSPSYQASAAAADARGAKMALEEQVPLNSDGTNPLTEVNKKIAYHNAVIDSMNDVPKTSKLNTILSTLGTMGGSIIGAAHGGVSGLEGGAIGYGAAKVVEGLKDSILAKTMGAKALMGLSNLLKGTQAASIVPASGRAVQDITQ